MAKSSLLPQDAVLLSLEDDVPHEFEAVRQASYDARLQGVLLRDDTHQRDVVVRSQQLQPLLQRDAPSAVFDRIELALKASELACFDDD